MPEIGAFRSRAITGRAMLTMVASRDTTKRLVQQSSRTATRRRRLSSVTVTPFVDPGAS